METKEFFKELNNDKKELERDIIQLCYKFSKKYQVEVNRINISPQIVCGFNVPWEILYTIDIDIKV
jgi:hypothetical protein